ncbi:hypothetical protein PENTCL1PPCAC_28939, partial [Pristionchus entomophagus]
MSSVLPDCSKECRNRRRDLRLQLSKWSHKAIIASGLEEIAVLLSQVDNGGPPLPETREEAVIPPTDWSPSFACVMCEVGQSTPTDKVSQVQPNQAQTNPVSSSTPFQPEQAGPSKPSMTRFPDELMAQACMSNMLAGQFNGMAAGLMHPDFAALLNMAAMMSKQEPGGKNALPPMLPFPPHPHMFHHLQQLQPPPQGRPKAEKPNALDLSRKS